MAETGIDLLRICAFCPNPCRAAISEDIADQRESRTPSALAYLAVALNEGYLQPDAATQAALQDLDLAELCRPVCVYGFDVPAELRAYVRRQFGEGEAGA